MIYHGGMTETKRSENYLLSEREFGLDLLVTYALVPPNWDRWKRPKFARKVMLDSGAFSAWNSGRELSLQEYIRFCKTRGEEFDVIVSLDVIDDPETTWENYCRMRDAGLDVLPIVHIRSNPAWIARYREHTSYIGLGGMNMPTGPRKRFLLSRIFSEYPDPRHTAFHGFGVSAATTIRMYPWCSIDCTSAWFHAMRGRRIGDHATHYPTDVDGIRDGFRESFWHNVKLLQQAASEAPAIFEHREDYLL